LTGADQLVQLEVHGGAIAVLGVLDQKHLQEGDDRGAGVNHQLPGVAESKQRTGDQPDESHIDDEAICT
jgi:hypothetical protein